MNILFLIAFLVGPLVSSQRVGLNQVESVLEGTAVGWQGLGTKYRRNDDVRSGDLKVQPG